MFTAYVYLYDKMFLFEFQTQFWVRLYKQEQTTMVYILNKCLFFTRSRWMRNLIYTCILVYLTLCFISIAPLVVKTTFRSVRNSRNSSLLLRVEPAEQQNFTCIWSAIEEREKCKPVCGPGFFGLYGMKRCHPLLDCVDIKKLKEKQDIGNSGYVKEVKTRRFIIFFSQ